MNHSKRAQMQMSVGTIVTIVLLMTVLILGLVLVRTIFKGATSSIGEIDQSVKNEINKLFSEDDSRKIVIYPATREISIKKGKEGGFGFSIRNLEEEDGSFSYEVTASEASCGLPLSEADKLINLGKAGSNINIKSGSITEDGILVKFKISESIPLCNIRYKIDVEKDGIQYGNSVSVDLNVLPS